MQYNSEATNIDLVTLTDDLADSNSSSYPIAKKTLYANMAVREILTWIWSVYGGWIYQDSNDSGDPYADINAVANTNKIAIPTATLDLTGVSYLDSTNNEYNPLKPITLEQIQERGYTLQNFMNTAGIPQYYLPLGNFLYIFPALPSNLTAGFRAFFSRGSSAFATTDTTKTPGFNSEFHEAVAVFMALHYKSISDKRKQKLQFDWDGNEAYTGREGGFKKRIKTFYASRFRQLFPPRFRTGDPVQDYI